ncbi:hypothetical protein [Rubellicoccus peritrichatus]|uniref:Uncharacterized protein n=1 Tax=Rubellicoccus peritrichatus TaxID=3080537 RepID=A0AAQ3LBZ4_9BACT|nr:hypothetical protein [Puniceicoccus sp. CR14]WOO42920.1 hypothetical protein RZN69_07430 [Puniceicoccus sp. CR14]
MCGVASFLGAIFFLVVCLFLHSLGIGRWSFASAMLMALCIDGVYWFFVVKNDMRSFSLKFAFVGMAMLKVFPIGMCLVVPFSEDYLFPWSEYLFTAPVTAGLAGVIRTTSIVVVYLISRMFFVSKFYDVPIQKMLFRTSPRYEFFLAFAGVINLLYWLSLTALDNPIFYFVRILDKTLLVVPFFVGLTAFKYKKVTIFWCGVLLIQLMIAFLTGTRGAAFTPMIYFLVGFVIGLPGWNARIRWGASFVLPLSVALLVAGVFIGSARNVTGRTDLKGALTEGSMIDALQSSVMSSQVSHRGNAPSEAFRRLTLWPEYVVPVMTPNPIPYRGFSDFMYEIRASFGLGIFALINPNWQGTYYLANIHLQPYGFAVHVGADGMQTSSVELPIQIDAFMRGGWFFAFVFTVFGYSVVFLVERLLRNRLLPRRQPLFLMILMMLCYIAFARFNKSGLVDSMRQLVMEGGFSLVVYYLFDRGLKRLGKPE